MELLEPIVAPAKYWKLLGLDFCHNLSSSLCLQKVSLVTIFCFCNLMFNCVHETPIVLWCNKAACAQIVTEIYPEQFSVFCRRNNRLKCGGPRLQQVVTSQGWWQWQSVRSKQTVSQTDHTCHPITARPLTWPQLSRHSSVSSAGPGAAPAPLRPPHRAPPQSRRTLSPHQRPPLSLCPVIQSLATPTVCQSR